MRFVKQYASRPVLALLIALALAVQGARHAVANVEHLAVRLLGITASDLCHGSGGVPQPGSAGASDCCKACPCFGAIAPTSRTRVAARAIAAIDEAQHNVGPTASLRSALSDRTTGPRGPPG